MQISATILRRARRGPSARDVRAALDAAARVPEIADRLPGDASLAVKLSGDRALRSLNAQFAGIDDVTDVLAFPASGEQAEGHYLGDIVISVAAAEREAAHHRHSAHEEVLLLVVHGFLHLLGWDHSTAAEEDEMTRVTLLALAGAGVSIERPRLVHHARE